eukprot:2916787-Rhodomonas_salina.1
MKDNDSDLSHFSRQSCGASRLRLAALCGRALLLKDTVCTAMLHLDKRLPVYNTAAVRNALPSLDHSLLPVLCEAVGTPPTLTVFFCKGFRHALALQTAIQFDLSLGSLRLSPQPPPATYFLPLPLHLTLSFFTSFLGAAPPSTLSSRSGAAVPSLPRCSVDSSHPSADSSHPFSRSLGNASATFFPQLLSSPAPAACRGHSCLASARPLQCPSFHVNPVVGWQ